MVQTALPSGTVSNDWAVTGSLPTALQTKDGDTSKITALTEGDLCRVNVDSLTDPEVNTGHFIRINAQAAGSGGPERIVLRLFEGGTQRAVSTAIAITRSSYNDFSYELTTGEADSITDYTDLRIEIDADTRGVGEVLDVTYAAFEIPDVATGFAHTQVIIT